MSRRLVVVTGGAGFIGSNIVAELTEEPGRIAHAFGTCVIQLRLHAVLQALLKDDLQCVVVADAVGG